MAPVKLIISLPDQDSVSGRRDAIGHDFQIAKSRFHVGRYVNVGGRDARKGHGHGVVIMRAAVKNVSGADIGQAHNGVICGRLGIISVGNRLRKAVEVAAAEDEAAAAAKPAAPPTINALGSQLGLGVPVGV